MKGSLLNASLPSGNASFQLQSSEKYVLVLGNVSNPTNATYTLSTAGTKTLPSVSTLVKHNCNETVQTIRLRSSHQKVVYPAQKISSLSDSMGDLWDYCNRIDTSSSDSHLWILDVTNEHKSSLDTAYCVSCSIA